MCKLQSEMTTKHYTNKGTVRIVVTSDDNSLLKIVSVGRLGKHKGQRWLLDVYRKAIPSFNRPTNLILVGGDEGQKVLLQAILSRVVEFWTPIHQIGDAGESPFLFKEVVAYLSWGGYVPAASLAAPFVFWGYEEGWNWSLDEI